MEKWRTKISAKFWCVIWFFNHMRRISRSVVFFEGGQVHLGPNWVDWRWNIQNTDQLKGNKDVCSINKKSGSTLYRCRVWCRAVWWTASRVGHARQSETVKRCSPTRVQSEPNIIVYSVVIFTSPPRFKVEEKQQVSPLEFHNVYNNDYILHFMTKYSQLIFICKTCPFVYM